MSGMHTSLGTVRLLAPPLMRGPGRCGTVAVQAHIRRLWRQGHFVSAAVSSRFAHCLPASVVARTAWLRQGAMRASIRVNAKQSPLFSSSAVAVKQTAKLTFATADGSESVEVDAEIGQSMLDIAQEAGLEMEGACEGTMCCSTCHVILSEDLYERLDEPEEEELDMLDMALGLTDTSRLGCQVIMDKDMAGEVIKLPAEVANYLGDE